MNTRVLPADLYDYLELMALEYGGIGAGALEIRQDINSDPVPYCIHGMCRFGDSGYTYKYGTISNQLIHDVSFTDNDNAVVSINISKGIIKAKNVRVSWEEYCAELNIVRGEHGK